MIADMGTKALPEKPFVMFRDVMNGYAIVRAAYPDKKMSDLIYRGDVSGLIENNLKGMQINLLLFPWLNADEVLAAADIQK
jgi:hypothetical protein